MRLPLKKTLSALADLPAHIVTFRGHLARLTPAGQAPLALDAYRLFLASLSSFPVFHQYTLLWTMQSGAIAQQTLERYATYIEDQHSNILAQSTLPPFARNVEGYEYGASEDDGTMGGDIIYPTPSPPSYPQYPTANAMQPFYPPHQPYPPQQFLPPPPGLGFHPYPYPMANGFYPSPPPAVAPAPAYSPSDKKGNRQKGNTNDKKGQT